MTDTPMAMSTSGTHCHYLSCVCLPQEWHLVSLIIIDHNIHIMQTTVIKAGCSLCLLCQGLLKSTVLTPTACYNRRADFEFPWAPSRAELVGPDCLREYMEGGKDWEQAGYKSKILLKGANQVWPEQQDWAEGRPTLSWVRDTREVGPN